uniref:U-box domain-containing protein n=1 Tax=Tanacetum cinerariifolium TaxID=118510 RepID=A0A6L2LMW9_TANCI|nr:E3 ubiquitin-protein ligase PUB23-like [Tanacetum cinerariifolium]
MSTITMRIAMRKREAAFNKDLCSSRQNLDVWLERACLYFVVGLKEKHLRTVTVILVLLVCTSGSLKGFVCQELRVSHPALIEMSMGHTGAHRTESDMNKRSMEAVGAAEYLVHIISNASSNMSSSPLTEEVLDVEAVDEAISILYNLYHKPALNPCLEKLLCLSADGRAELLKHEAGLAVVSKKIFRVSHAASGRAVRILHSVAKLS